jgi:8-oxo-dGTP diphosphatase
VTAATAAPALAVDVAVFTVLDHALRLLLVELQHGVLAGQWALPGGRVRVEDSLDRAARRELAAQTGLRSVYLEQLYTFGSLRRDPHGRVVSVAYLALVAPGDVPGPPRPSPKYAAVAWRRVAQLPPLAYDHATVVRTALARLRAKLGYTNLAFTLLPAAFTLGELQATYETVLGRTLDRRNFRKKVLALGLLRHLDRVRRGPHRPAALYAFRHRRPMAIDIL